MYIVGRILSIILDRGGGTDRYSFPSENDVIGGGSEIIEPRKAILAIQVDERRGSNVSEDADQNLPTCVSVVRFAAETTILTLQQAPDMLSGCEERAPVALDHHLVSES